MSHLYHLKDKTRDKAKLKNFEENLCLTRYLTSFYELYLLYKIEFLN